MMFSGDFTIRLWLVAALLVGQANCFPLGQSRTVRFDETFALQPRESAVTEDGKLTIRLKGVGRKIAESGEIEYAELEVRLNGSQRIIVIGENKTAEATVGAFTVKLVNAESFGENPHCRLKISRRR